MNQMDMIYDLLKEVREDVKIVRSTGEDNAIILEEHQRRSLANEARLAVLEDRVIDWKAVGKKVGILLGIISAATGIIYTVIRIIAVT